METEIKLVWHFRQSPQMVWEYLTKPELLEQWLTKTDFQPIVGQPFQFLDKTGKIVRCKVLEVKPFTRLSYSWQYHSAKDGRVIDSRVVWMLVPAGNGTDLQLVHNGFTAPEDHAAHNNGWTNLGMRLTELLNTPVK